MIKALWIVLGFFVFFAPGYLLSLILYPKKKDLDFWERVGTSIGLGALIVAVICFVLALPALRALEIVPFLATTALFCIACGIILIYRRR